MSKRTPQEFRNDEKQVERGRATMKGPDLSFAYTEASTIPRIKSQIRKTTDKASKRKLVDASLLVSAIRSCDRNHPSSYRYIHEHSDSIWLIPAIAYFEYQAAQSRLEREGKGAYRPIYIPNCQILPIDQTIIQESMKRDLVNLFSNLKGADLIYACFAFIEDIPLVTLDADFNKYNHKITVINPSDNCGDVRIKVGKTTHQGSWALDQSSSILTVTTKSGKKATQLGGMTKHALARILLRELVEADSV